MSFKYKVGDKVRIKDLTKCENKPPLILSGMLKFSGQIFTINYINEHNVQFFEIPYKWHIDWLEEPLKDKLKNILNR
mgnify:CR=1 FL=1